LKQSISLIVLPKRIVDEAIKLFEYNLPRESLLFLFGKVERRSKKQLLIATETLIPEDKDYVFKSQSGCEISYKYIAREFLGLLEKHELVATWHCHPIHGLSSIDKHDGHTVMTKVFPNQLTGYYNSGKFAFYQYKEDFEPVPHNVVDTEAYDRQVRAFTEFAQLQLASAHVAIIGCGGLGSQLAFLLAQKGIGKLTLIDPDKWDRTSLNRVWIPHWCVGENKAESLADLLRWRDLDVGTHPCRVEDLAEERFEDADILVATTDSITGRIYVNRLAIKAEKPAIFAATEIKANPQNIEAMMGDCLVYLPNQTPCFECNLSVDAMQIARETTEPELWKKYAAKYGLPLDLPPSPSVVDLNICVSSLVSDEITKILTGHAKPLHHLYLDFLSRHLITIEASRNPECTACKAPEKVELRESDLISTEQALTAVTRHD